MPSASVLREYAPDPSLYRPSCCPDWIDELDLPIGAAHVRMGTRSLDEADWLLRDELADPELTLRRRLLSEQRGAVFACNPVADDAAREVAELVDSWLRARGLPASDPALDSHPLARAGVSVQEDLCVMVRHDGAWHLEGAILCFPSLWSLADKLGRPTAEVHAPVPYYADELSARVDTFFDRLPEGRLVWRRNLSLWPTPLLWVPTARIDPELWDPEAEPGSPRLYLRSERQTLRRLSGSPAIVFSIRVQVASLSVLEHRPARAGDVARWLRGPASEGRRRQLGAVLGPDLEWLDRVAQSGAA